MDPIVTPALLAALYAAIKKKAVGVAADRIVEAAQVQAVKLQGLLPKGDEEKAEALVTHVLAESAKYLPEDALLVTPLATVGDVGIFGPAGRLQLKMLWVNLADFPIRVRDLELKARIGGKAPEWNIRVGDEFVLDGRSHEERELRGEPVLPLPEIEHGGTQVEVTMSALVSGPWADGMAHRTHNIVKTSLWLPAPGMAPRPVELLKDASDIDLVLEDYIAGFVNKGTEATNVNYAELDRAKKLRSGATMERLPTVAARLGHKLAAGFEVGRLTFHYPGFLLNGGDEDYGGWSK